jgi:hypothetical protein
MVRSLLEEQAMNKSKQFPFAMPEGMPTLPGLGKESFEWMSTAFSEWLSNANRMQAEVIRFIGDRYSKDVKMMMRFAECRKPEDFLKLQSELAAELTADYQEEGARLLALFGDASKQAWQEIAKPGEKQSARVSRARTATPSHSRTAPKRRKKR